MSKSLYWLRNDGDIQQHAASSAVITAAARVITNFTLVHRDMLARCSTTLVMLRVRITTGN